VTLDKEGVRSRLRTLADELIGPVDGAYLRPWMCDGDPSLARVLLIGANPATPFSAAMVDRQSYLDALVHGGQPLRDIYLAARGGRESLTRRNIGRVVGLLRAARVEPVLETNVWTLPTKSLALLKRSEPDVVAASSRVVPELVRLLQPVALIVHGAEASRGLAKVLGRELEPPNQLHVVRRSPGWPDIFVLLSLSPPAANTWLRRSDGELRLLAKDVASLVGAVR
jgi:hypothetical protein